MLIKSDFDCIDAILSSINAGTLVGVPKRKAMEIISNLENEPRKFYGGNLIHIKPDANIIAIILIRTAFLNQSKITFQEPTHSQDSPRLHPYYPPQPHQHPHNLH
jgi:anthranilate/para-aminobenzoate synthase component I